MRVGYLGPEGTFTHEALMAATAGGEAGVAATAGGEAGVAPTAGGEAGVAPAAGVERVPLPTIYETVMAVASGTIDRALVPIENSVEGSVNATLDALAIETDSVSIVGEVVHPIRHCLIAKRELELEEIETVVSHPQATAQCSRFIRDRLPNAVVLAGSSTAQAVRMVAEHDQGWAALGNRLAAELYGCRILLANVEDVADNETRFVWLARADAADDGASGDAGAAWKTAIVFWGAGSDSPGWLVRCLGEFSSREVNLTRIESRPRKLGLGRYMFFLDLEGRASAPRVKAALDAVTEQVEVLRVLGSFPAC